MTTPDYKALSRGISRDMSPDAIARRLRIAGELYRLAETLSRAEYVGPVETTRDETRSNEVRERPQDEPEKRD